MKSPPRMPPFGGALGGKPVPNQQQQQQAVQAAIGQLSLGIYSQLAIAHFTQPPGPISEWTSADHQHELRKIAKDSQTAARCYFEQVGAIPQDAQEDNE